MGEEGKNLTELDPEIKKSGTVQGTPPKEPEEDSKKYAEKTQEELIAMLQESEKALQQRASREKELLDTVSVLKDVQKPTQQPQAGFYNEEVVEEKRQTPIDETISSGENEYLDAKQTKELFKQTLKEDREKQQKETGKRLATLAGIAYEQAKKHMKKHPELFKGIEEEVGQTMVNQLKPALEQGYDVSTYVGNPDFVDRTGKAVRFMREEYEYLKPSQQAGFQPVSSVPGQTPNPTKEIPMQQEPAINIDDKSRFLMDELDLTEEEAKKGIMKGRRHARGED